MEIHRDIYLCSVNGLLSTVELIFMSLVQEVSSFNVNNELEIFMNRTLM